MSIPSQVREQIEEKLSRYCSGKVPESFHDKLRVSFKISGDSVTLFEERPAFFAPSKWVDIKVAQFRYDPDSKETKGLQLA